MNNPHRKSCAILIDVPQLDDVSALYLPLAAFAALSARRLVALLKDVRHRLPVNRRWCFCLYYILTCEEVVLFAPCMRLFLFPRLIGSAKSRARLASCCTFHHGCARPRPSRLRGLFRTALCHFRQPEIDRVSEYCGKRKSSIFRRFIGR